MIVEYRQQPFEVPNVFAAVEIKFPRDWVRDKQMDSYVRLMRNDNTKVALLRVPEDCTGYSLKTSDDEHQSQRSGTAGGKGKR